MKFNQLQMLVNKGEVKYFTESKTKDYYANQDSTIYSVSKKTGKVTILKHTVQKMNAGYVGVTIEKTMHVHKIIANLFVFNPNPDKFKEVDHIDGDKSNNSVYNLRWTDRKGNMKFAFENGLVKREARVKRFTLEQANEIRELYATGEFSMYRLGKMYGVHQSLIGNIVKNKTYKQ